jgi:hypothetical protein
MVSIHQKRTYTLALSVVMIRVPDTESILASSFEHLIIFIIHDSATIRNIVIGCILLEAVHLKPLSDHISTAVRNLNCYC